MDFKSATAIINNEFDYSNSLPTTECLLYLVQYMDEIYQSFEKMLANDEEKNKQFKPEYKEWNYKRMFSEQFEIYIREKTYNNLSCKDFESFKSAVESGSLSNITGMTIKMDMDFKRGIGENLDEYENSFYISFEPFNTKFARKSNHDEADMSQIENNIKAILEKFPTMNTIFCTK